MDRRETRESVNSGCNCLIISVIVLALVISCARSLINGDIKLPRFGSSHVSGGSGSYGTSNGYNVKYKQTTSPNYNSSLRDYTHTNNQPTEHRDGRIERSSNSPVDLQPQKQNNQSSQIPVQMNSSNAFYDIISDYERQFTTCPECKGKGYVLRSWTFTGESGSPCVICWKTERHEHVNEEQRCYKCMGNGKVRIE